MDDAVLRRRRLLPLLVTTFGLLVIHSIMPMAVAQIPELPPIGGGSSDPKVPPTPPLPPPLDPKHFDPPLPLKDPGRTDPPSLPRLGGPVTLGEPTAPPAGVPSGELELVEKVIAARRVYAESLKALQDHYRATRDERRLRLAEEELRAFYRNPQPVYRIELDVPGPQRRPLENVSAANDLFRWALSYKDKGFGTEYIDNMHRAELLLQELLTKYPTSTKIAEAAYLLGEIYESRAFRQYERAAAYFERCFQWNPATPSDARLRAARIYDRELRDRAKAIELYRLALDAETSPARRQDATRRLSELGAR